MTLARDIALAADPVALADALKFEPDEWQSKALRSTAPRSLWLCCRQSGKSTTAAVLALRKALYEPGTTTLVVAPSQRQSTELFNKVIANYKQLGRPVPSDTENRLSLTLENRSRVVALPGTGDSIRGYSADLLILDEASRIEDKLYGDVRPMLAVTGGQLVALSTPRGRRGWFYQEWTDGSREWERVKVTADECPRITAEFLEAERRSLGEWLYRQEYECAFQENVAAVFRMADIDAAADPTLDFIDLTKGD